MHDRRSLRWAGLIGLLLLLYLFALGNHGLFEDSEARYFEISWEMTQSGDWMTPRLNFIKHFDKPPVAYWAVASSLEVFGDSEWAGRLPVALAALLTVLLTGWLGERMGEPGMGFASALVLGTSLEFWLLGRIVLTDMFLTLTVTAAMACAWMILEERPGPWWLGFWAALGVSMMTKGPLGLVLVAFGVIGTMAWTRRWKWSAFRPLPGLLLWCGIALPWYVVEVFRNPGLLHFFLVFQTADRVATTINHRAGPLWFYLPALMVGFLPWIGLLPAAALRAWRRADVADKFLLLWVVPAFVMFSLIGSKLYTYILPLYPAMALMVGRLWASRQRLKWPSVAGWSVMALFATAVWVFVSHRMPPEVVSARPLLRDLAVAASIGCAVGLMLLIRRRATASLMGLALTSAAVLLILGLVLGRADTFYTAKAVARVVKSVSTGKERVAEYAYHLDGLPYYLDRRLIHVSYPRDLQFEAPGSTRGYYYRDLSSFMASIKPGDHTIIIVRRSDYDAKRFKGWIATRVGYFFVLHRPHRAQTKSLTQAARSSP